MFCFRFRLTPFDNEFGRHRCGSQTHMISILINRNIYMQAIMINESYTDLLEFENYIKCKQLLIENKAHQNQSFLHLATSFTRQFLKIQ